MYNPNKYTYEVDTYHVIELELSGSNQDIYHLQWISNQEHYLYNSIIGFLNKNYKQLLNIRKYHRLKLAYKNTCEKLSKLDENDLNYNLYENKKNDIGNKLNSLYKKYHLTKKDIDDFVKNLNLTNINSIFILTTKERAYKSLETVLYNNGRAFKFKSIKNDQPSICAKQINRGITIKFKNEECFIHVGQPKNGKKSITLKLKELKENDIFIKEEFSELKKYLTTKDIDKFYENEYIKTNIKQNTHRPCFLKIVFKQIRHKVRIFLQITIVGPSKSKKDKNGNPRHQFTDGIIGLDLGPQTVAVVGSDIVLNTNLAERNHKSSRDTEYKNKKLLKKMDKSRRYTNPQNYDKDNTIKKDSKNFKKVWKKSKRYKKLEYKLHEKYRKDALTRKYANQELANKIREHGSIIITEKNNIESLKRRNKKTENSNKKILKKDKNSKIQEITKKKKKKRFGKSIQNRCPGAFLVDCNKKFKEVLTVDMMFRASQYDHTNDTYKKKELNIRQFKLSDGTIVQRDIYSAFLLYCTNKTLTTPDRNLCITHFENFYKLYKGFEKYVEDNHIKILNYK